MSRKYNTELIIGGLSEIAKFISEDLKCKDTSKVKKMLLKSDNIELKGLEDFDVFDLGEIIRYMAHGVFENIYSSDYIEENLKGSTDLFAGGNTNLEKCQTFLKNSTLEEEDKEELMALLPDFEVNFSLYETIHKHYIEDYPEYFQIISYVLDINLELEKRLTTLDGTLRSLHKAIDKNLELLKPNAPPHLSICAKILNDSHENCLKAINSSLFEYVNKLGNPLYGFQKRTNSRKDLLAKLCDPSNIDLFLKYEKELANKGIISKNLDYWNDTPKKFLGFYIFCQNKFIFFERHRPKSSGVKILRELYDYEDGSSMDVPNKRNSRVSDAFVKSEYYYLHII